MSHVNLSLKPRHHLILQYAFNGLNNVEIALKVGLTRATVGCVLRSPAAQAELARMAAAAIEKSTNIPARIALHNELNASAHEAVRLVRAIQRDPTTKPETRVKVAQHLMDRVIFDKRSDGDEREMSYRDLLRKLDKIEAKIESPQLPELERVIDIPTTGVQGEADTPLDTECSGTDSDLTGNEKPHLELISGGKRIIDVSDPD